MQYPAKLEALFAQLNTHQINAVNHGAGQAGVLGVPGSGKTTTLVARMARLVADGVPPSAILAMTFTKHAAVEMTTRLHATKLPGIKDARIGTIHSVALQVVMEATRVAAGLRVDEKGKLTLELKRLLSDLRRANRIPKTGVDFRAVQRFIAHTKANGPCYIYGDPFSLNVRVERTAEELAAKSVFGLLTGLRPAQLAHVCMEIERRRAIAGLYDFDDMLLWAWMALASDAELRAGWCSRWSVIIVDEAQDSVPVQWDLARFMAGLPTCIKTAKAFRLGTETLGDMHNLMIGGQVEQSIYGWRSAVPEQFVSYIDEDCTAVYRLPVNYRSGYAICSAASKIVCGQSWAVTGVIEPAHESAGTIRVVEYTDLVAEAANVVRKCQEVIAGDMSCAVLSRLRLGLDLIEVECVRNRIPYCRLVGGNFFESPEVTDIMAYIRVAAGLDTTGEWLRHIINRPFRYIGTPALRQAEHISKADDISLLDALFKVKLTYQQVAGLRALYDLLVEMNELAQARAIPGVMSPPAIMVTVMLSQTNYLESVRREEGLADLDVSKQAAIATLVQIAAEFKTPAELLEYVDKLSNMVAQAGRTGLRKRKLRKDLVALSTIHGAKGLEWDHVYLVDVNKGRFPCANSTDFDEELRLLYVAITRAKDTCEVSYLSQAVSELGEVSDTTDTSPFITRLRRALEQGVNPETSSKFSMRNNFNSACRITRQSG